MYNHFVINPLASRFTWVQDFWRCNHSIPKIAEAWNTLVENRVTERVFTEGRRL